MDRAQVCVLKEADEIAETRRNLLHAARLKLQAANLRFCCLLKRKNGRRLESQVGFEVLSDLANEALKWQLADQKLGRFLVTTNLAKRDCARAVAMRLKARKEVDF